MRSPYTYTCPCGLVYTVPKEATGLRRVWGSINYAPRFTHTCPQCDRENYVHDGIVMLSLQSGKQQRH